MSDDMAGAKIYCSGYWQLEANLKRNLSHYQQLLPKTMKMIRGERLHLFCGDQFFASHAASLARRYSINLTSEIVDLGDLPTRDLIVPILRACESRRSLLPEFMDPTNASPLRREKGEIHFWRDYMRSGPGVYKDLLSIWTSKIPLVSRWISSAEMYHNGAVAWIDLSVSRFRGSRTRWNFCRQVWPEDRICHYSSPMAYKGKRLPLNASFIGAPSRLWSSLESLYLQCLESHASDGYAHDEETILSHVLESNPDLFSLIGHPCRGLQRVGLKALSVFGW